MKMEDLAKDLGTNSAHLAEFAPSWPTGGQRRMELVGGWAELDDEEVAAIRAAWETANGLVDAGGEDPRANTGLPPE